MGFNVQGGACYPTADAAVGAFLPSLPLDVVGADGSMVRAYPGIWGLLPCMDDWCAGPSLQVAYSRGVPAPGDPNADPFGYVWTDMPVVSYPLVECEYKGGAEYWAPVLGAFFLAGVVIVCAKAIAGIFRRETY